MKILTLLSVVALTQASLANAAIPDAREQCHQAALPMLKAKRAEFEKNLQEKEGLAISLEFAFNYPVDAPEPKPAYLVDSAAHYEGKIDGRHLLYVLGIREKAKQYHQGGIFVVQCSNDLSEIDDLNKDGKVDASDITWVKDIIAK